MNEMLKVKYYKLINNKDFLNYENVGNVLAMIENKLILSGNAIVASELIELLLPLKESESDVYNEILKDINSGLLYGGSDND